MNQLIEKIMYQADEVNIPEDDEYFETDFLANMDPRRVNLFAQMIIKECQDTIYNVWYEQGMDIRGAELGKFMGRFNQRIGVK